MMRGGPAILRHLLKACRLADRPPTDYKQSASTPMSVKMKAKGIQLGTYIKRIATVPAGGVTLSGDQ